MARRRLNWWIDKAPLVLSFALLGFGGSAHALNVTVGNEAELRTALANVAADTNADDDTITLSDDIEYSIGGIGEDDGVTGDFDLRRNASGDFGTLIIDGDGHFVDADGRDRVFDVLNMHGNPVIFRNLTIQDGEATDGEDGAEGGGIRICDYGNDVTLDNVTVQNNSAVGPSGSLPASNGELAYGGGVYIYGGTLTIQNSSMILNNEARGGTGSSGSPFGGSGGNGEKARGGGVFAYFATLNVTASTVQGNDALGGDGGRAGSGSSPGSSGGVGGSAGSASGGGIYAEGTAVTLTNTQLMSNTAIAGSGGRGGNGAFSSSGNGGNGGTGGSGAQAYGGGLFTSSFATLNIVEMTNNTATGGVGGSGGNGGAGGSTITPANGGTGGAGGSGGLAQGGGIYTSYGMTVTDLTLDNNTATGGVGGIGGAGGAGSFGGGNGGTGGSSGLAQGGGVYASVSFDTSLDGVSVSNNTVTGGAGGNAGDGGAAISNGGAAGTGGPGGHAQGGGLWVRNDSGSILLIENSAIHTNDLAAGDGGTGGNGGAAVITGAGGDGGDGGSSDGGGIYFFGGTQELKVRNTTVSTNTATRGNGGVGGAGITFGSSGNSGASEGGGVFQNGGTLRIYNSTVAFNTVEDSGGGVGFGTGSFEAISTLISDNGAAAGPDIDTSSTLTNCLVGDTSGSGITPGNNNVLDQDPGLGSLQDNGGPTLTHGIDRTSPAFNTGANPDVLENDQRGTGFPRDSAGAVDIGALEIQTFPFGHGIDGDGDGFDAEIEGIFGTSDANASETPLGGAAAPLDPEAFTLKKLRIKLNFKPGKEEKDSIKLSGSIPLPDDFDFDGVTVAFDIAGVVLGFDLDAKRKGQSLDKTQKVKFGKVKKGESKFNLTLKKSDIKADAEANANLADEDVNNELRDVDAAVIVEDTDAWGQTVEQTYKAKMSKTGKTK